MNWKRESIDELKGYEAKRVAMENLTEEIRQLNAQRVKLVGSGDSTPVKGGSAPWEERQINLIAKIDKLKMSLRYDREWVSRVERALAVLSNEERLILDLFYINPAKGNVARLCEELYLEKTAVYSKKDAALRHYTLARYGCIEI